MEVAWKQYSSKVYPRYTHPASPHLLSPRLKMALSLGFGVSPTLEVYAVENREQRPCIGVGPGFWILQGLWGSGV